MALSTTHSRPLMLTTIVVWVLLCLLSVTAALPTAPNINTRTCTNYLINPSFESGAIEPWLPIVESAWSTRGVFANPFTHQGTHYYYAHATSTVESTLTLSQSGLNAPVGATVDCYAWVAGKRGEGVTRIEVILDGVSCGASQFNVGEDGWKKVGGKVKVIGGVPETGSTLAIVVTSKSAGDEGWEVWVDDVGVVSC
ncbi:hypothetical protein BU25DRAFT_424943 [Macroventuria anomochaeta]|uniref:Uncharacterized protein n=1 Tax=Macroventuria anomochaeta TaxID=301207 RepID=A0ACB6RQN1_9PLEO|nr:uncharacterized protein BU25DRAFT_424943 [Macroventuria anomochaeta]KAF2623438.1 hypothetical protein BU25DRAFT_424943 [Macroventuria anomochaeta]